MNIVNFLKNALKFKDELSSYKENDVSYSFKLLKRGLELMKQKCEDDMPYEVSLSISAYTECLDKIIKNDFLKDTAQHVLEDSFNEEEFNKNKFDYIMSLPPAINSQILNDTLKMYNFTVKIMNDILSHPECGLHYWFSINWKK